MEGRENPMWNCDWEYENQETLKQWNEEKLAGIRPYSAVRKIVCKGCGRDFYTLIETKKYCYYHLCGNRGYQKDLKQLNLQRMRKNFYTQAVRCGLLLQRLPPAGLSPERYR